MELQRSWAGWWDRLYSIPPPPERVAELIHCLRRFHAGHEAADVARVVAQLSQGKHLVQAALCWVAPTTGATPVDRMRGEQWRLVMGYSGLERSIRALMDEEKRFGLEKGQIQQFIDACGLDDFGEPILSPEKPTCKETNDALASMRSIVRGFLDGQGAKTWTDAVCLAQGLRNATAHGSLSAVRAYRGRLRPVFNRLAMIMGRVMAGALERLAEP